MTARNIRTTIELRYDDSSVVKKGDDGDGCYLRLWRSETVGHPSEHHGAPEWYIGSATVGDRSNVPHSADSGCAAPNRGVVFGLRMVGSRPDIECFAIGFDHRDRARLHQLWDEIIDREHWSEGPITLAFEAAWQTWNGLPALAFGNWAGAALAALDFAGVRGETVLCPSNTFMATPLSVVTAGGHVVFVDCNRTDLCASLADFEAKLRKHRPKAAFVVHIGGHIAFDWQNPLFAEATASIALAAKKAGKVWGMPGGSPARMAELLELGARIFCYGVDILWIKAGIELLQQQLGPLGFTFDNRLAMPPGVVRKV